MTVYLTAHQVLHVHSKLAPQQTVKHGGFHLIESAISRPSTSFSDYEIYPEIHLKAAVLLEGLIQNHPFTDGNKRTAYTCTVLLLRLNGYRMNPALTDQQQADFVVSVASHRLHLEGIVLWLEKHSYHI